MLATQTTLSWFAQLTKTPPCPPSSSSSSSSYCSRCWHAWLARSDLGLGTEMQGGGSLNLKYSYSNMSDVTLTNKHCIIKRNMKLPYPVFNSSNFGLFGLTYRFRWDRIRLPLWRLLLAVLQGRYSMQFLRAFDFSWFWTWVSMRSKYTLYGV